MDGIGDRFQQQSKYDPEQMPGGLLDWAARPPLYKEYTGRPRIELRVFKPKGHMSLDRALRTRKSIRNFGQKPISKGQLSYLLWASTGIQRVEEGYEFRTAPSAGALYPVETYVVVNNVAEVEKGLYHYAVKSHQLEQLKQGDYGSAVADGASPSLRLAQTSAVAK